MQLYPYYVCNVLFQVIKVFKMKILLECKVFIAAKKYYENLCTPAHLQKKTLGLNLKFGPIYDVENEVYE